MAIDSQNKARLAGSALIIAMFTAAIGYVIATGVAQWWLSQPAPQLTYIARHYFTIQQAFPRLFNIINIIIIASFVGGLALASKVVTARLTAFGTTHWMTKRELQQKSFHADPRVGFVLGKTSGPSQKGRFIVSGKHPHCLLVAPTGRGKGVGFVIPNLLSYKGSAVVLDVKGENYEQTARFRQSMGQRIYRFSPRDFDQPSHRYNPLERIKSFSNPAKRMAELEKTATLFLQAEDASSSSFLPNSREVFVACAILAYEQGNLTLGHIYKLAFGGLAPNVKFGAFVDEVKDRSAKLLFQKLANTTEKTLSAYLSVLSSSGMSPWANPHTCAVTAKTDFDFASFRKSPQTAYFTVPSDDITAIAPLVRLFFSDLIATLQHHEPGKDEPFPVLILLDEFQRLGRMQIVIDSISLLRSYRGNLAIVTQTIPNLDEVYGETSRKALQGGAGIKLYLTPSEEDTVNELSTAVGTTTKHVVSKSRTIGKDGIFGTNVSERTEEHPLLTTDSARRLPDDEIIIVVDADMPVRAKRIVYYEDHAYQELYESQDFNAPLPTPPHIITEADYEFIETDSDRSAQRRTTENAKKAAVNRALQKSNGTASMDELAKSAEQEGQGGDATKTEESTPRSKVDSAKVQKIARRTRPRPVLPEPDLGDEVAGDKEAALAKARNTTAALAALIRSRDAA